jgi:hypothetical protein
VPVRGTGGEEEEEGGGGGRGDLDAFWVPGRGMGGEEREEGGGGGEGDRSRAASDDDYTTALSCGIIHNPTQLIEGSPRAA